MWNYLSVRTETSFKDNIIVGSSTGAAGESFPLISRAFMNSACEKRKRQKD